MKSTEFITLWDRPGDFTCTTHCPRCGGCVVAEAGGIEKNRTIRCESCDNEGVGTAKSVVWKSAHEGRETLGEAVARTEPKKLPKRVAKPIYREEEKKKTSTWLTAADARTSVKVEGATFHPGMKVEFKEITPGIDKAIEAGLLKRTRPLEDARDAMMGAFETKALDEALVMDKESLGTYTPSKAPSKYVKANLGHRYVGAEEEGYIVKCLRCQKAQLVTKVASPMQEFECSYCKNPAKISRPIEGEFRTWPPKITVRWEYGEDDGRPRCGLCRMTKYKSRTEHHAQVCDSCHALHGRSLHLGATAGDIQAKAASLIYDPEYKDSEAGEYYAECPFCLTGARVSVEKSASLRGDWASSSDVTFGCSCGAAIQVVEPIDDTAAKRIPVRWSLAYANTKVKKKRRKAKASERKEESEPLSFETSEGLIELFRRPV